MWPFIISLSGIAVGMLLAWLVPEELEIGKKYFFFAQQALLAVMIFVSFYFLRDLSLSWQKDLLLLLPLLLSGVLFLLNFYFNAHSLSFFTKTLFSLLPYIFFAFVYFQHFSSISVFPVTIAIILFLYGFPTGTLLWMHWNETKMNN